MDVQIACPCEGAPHDKDIITFREALDYRSIASMRWALIMQREEDPGATPDDIMGLLSEKYLIYGVEAWTCTAPDDKGKQVPLPVTKPGIREVLLADIDLALTLAAEADNFYSSQVVSPLVKMAARSSPQPPTDDSTSPTSSLSPESPTPSKRSSTSTIRTASTAATDDEPAGDSSTSPSLALVAG